MCSTVEVGEELEGGYIWKPNVAMGDGDEYVVYCTDEELFECFVGSIDLFVEPVYIAMSLEDGGDLCRCL